MATKSIRVNLYGKPSERLIFVGLCQKYKCSFSYNQTSGMAIAQGTNAFELRSEYNKVINVAYRALAFAQADSKLSEVPNKTLVSQFMRTYARITYALLTGEPLQWYAKTEAERAAIRALSKNA